MKNAASCNSNVRWLATLVAVFAFAAADGATTTRKWTGGGPDDKWSTPQNWEGGVAPGEDEVLLFEPTDADIVTENDVEDFAVKTLRFSGGHQVTVNGKRIKIGGASVMWSNQCVVVCNADLRLASSHTLHCWEATTFNGDISIDDGCAPYLGAGSQSEPMAKVYFYGRLSGPKAKWNSYRGGSGVRPTDYYYGPVDVATFAMPSGTRGGFVYFYNEANACTNLTGAYDTFYFKKRNQFPAATTLTLQNGNYGGQTANLSEDQTFRRLTTKYEKVEKNYSHIVSDNKSTMTVLGDEDCESTVYMTGSVNFIWAPPEHHVFSLSRARKSETDVMGNNTTGFIAVSNGTFRLTDGVAFTALSRIRLFNSACFEVAADTENPFGVSPKTALELHGASTLSLASALTVKTFELDGILLDAGDYGADDLPGRLTGTGTLHVLSAGPAATYWTGPVGGQWSVAGHWTDGLPSASLAAMVTRDADDVVDFDVARLDGGLTVSSVLGNPTVKILADAELAGTVTLGDADSSERRGTLAITGGDVAYTNKADMTVYSGGTLIVTNDASLTFAPNYLAMRGGLVDVSGSAVVTLGMTKAFRQCMQTGTFRIRGQARVRCSTAGASRAGFTPKNAGETCTVEAMDNAVLDSDLDSSWINTTGSGGCSGSTTKMLLTGHAQAHFGNSLSIANGDGTTGELSIADHAYADSTYYLTHVGGSDATSASTPAYGVLRVSGGAYSHRPSNNSSAERFFGVGVGFKTDSGEAANIGHVYLSGGAITNASKAALVIGGGAGQGFVHQTGGLFRAWPTQESLVTIIGFRGGEGSYEMSGETSRYEGRYDVYVGGCPTQVIARTYANLPTDRPGTGVLRIDGGSFSTDADLWVSREGRGTVEIGSAGTLSVRNLLLTNSVDGVDHTTKYVSTLAFKPTTGSGCVTVSGALTQAADAVISVDASALDPSVKRLTLMTFGSVNGTLKPTLVGGNPDEVGLKVCPDRLVLRRLCGTVLFVR